jgi:hypothetical protein
MAKYICSEDRNEEISDNLANIRECRVIISDLIH